MIGDKNCIFCKIVEGKEPASKVYEDDAILAFMDIRPINTGECMIIPKEHIDHFDDIPDDITSRIILIAQRLTKKIKENFKPLRVGYVVHGFGVPHAHLVLVPLNRRDDVTSAKFMKIDSGRIVIDFDQVPLQPREELDRAAKILRDV